MCYRGRLPRGSRLGLRLKVVLAVYVLAAALLPFGHHDLACHLKSTTHCTTCAVGSSAEAAADPTLLARFWLHDAGATLPDPADASRSVTCRPASGRAPPVAA
jgi:hypothetical protein